MILKKEQAKTINWQRRCSGFLIAANAAQKVFLPLVLNKLNFGSIDLERALIGQSTSEPRPQGTSLTVH